ncbi:serine/threonine transporter [Zooshikella ganghwensis]|uniref:HAAAP family serine/threonine permease n=1 Tax=Zooshikella ganghwensis TaxID=202772 RepID=A0A4P9VTS4_9GAMM|nr:serine/threonine transporter [Zooshikella ganghwensis]RDH46087.1 HAAAP family serine/threonine permease [Zooshikella ganghwensis]
MNNEEVVQSSAVENNVKKSTWTKNDVSWVLSLFGTAVGAGVLFLPINAGMAGFWPLVIMTILVGPMTYLAHRGLCRFVLSSGKPGSDITQVVAEHFGEGAGKLITILYFFAIYPILLIYGVGITNTVDSFLVNQLEVASPARWILSLVLIMGMMSVMLLGEKFMLKVTQLLVYPLIAILAVLSFWLIPEWNLSSLSDMPSLSSFSTTLWLTIPVLVFAFNHSPAISSFALAQHREYGKQAVQKSERILFANAGLLLGFVMLFVFSCVLSLSPAELAEAKAQNISILSYLANKQDSLIISYIGPVVAFLAIVSSFFGHYLGAREGLNGIISQQAKSAGITIPEKTVNLITIVFIIVTLWIVAIINPSILGMIESLGGPIIAAILFIMPMIAVRKVPAMQKYRGVWTNAFVLIMGCIAISAILYQLVA